MRFHGGKWGFTAAAVTMTALSFFSACSALPVVQEQTPDLNQDSAALPLTGRAFDIAEQGRWVYSQNCLECHGPAGEGGDGPAIMGPSSYVSAYGTALELYYFNAAAMPMTPPRVLSDEEYLQVTVFILLQNGYIGSDTTIDWNTLNDTIMTRQG